DFPPLVLSRSQEAIESSPTSPVAPELGAQAWVNSPPLTLASLRGKVVLLNFWASWCGPCVAELPQVQKAHELFAAKGLVVIGVHHNSVPAEEVRKFVQQQGLTFPVALDNREGATCGGYNVTRLPTVILIDRGGRMTQSFAGGAALLRAVRQVVLTP